MGERHPPRAICSAQKTGTHERVSIHARTRGRVPADSLARARETLHGDNMVKLESLQQALKPLPAAAVAAVDDERAQRIAKSVAMVEGALERLASARTPERLSNRTPAARRCIDRLCAELRCEGAPGWSETTAPALAALARVDAALEAVERAHAEAVQRIASALREAA